MTEDGWSQVIREAFGDADRTALLAKLLAEQDQAKERLRRLGFGVMGTPWAQVVEDVAAFTDWATAAAEGA